MLNASRTIRLAAAALSLSLYTVLPAQRPDLASSTAIHPFMMAEKPAVAAVAKPRTWQDKTDRWLDLNAFNYGARYRSTFDINGARAFNQGQERLIADGKFKFDPAGRYGLGFHLSSGRYFNWAYSDFIGGGQHLFVANTTARMKRFERYIFNLAPTQPGFYNSGGGELYLRQLFLAAEPIHGVELQYGGFAINHGVNSEATSYDDDGYMSGERISVRRPKQMWISELSYTRGYLGDLYNPNFFSRGQRLSLSNYWQILGRKDFGKHVSISSDYTFVRPEGATFFLKTTREALLVDTRRSKVVDKVRFEAYQRINGGFYTPVFPFKPGKGYALSLSRDFRHKANLDAGIVSVDTDYVNNLGVNAQAIILGLATNGDQYGIGKRYFARPTIQFGRGVSLTGAYTRLYGDAPQGVSGPVDVWNARMLTAGFQYDMRHALFGDPKTH